MDSISRRARIPGMGDDVPVLLQKLEAQLGAFEKPPAERLHADDAHPPAAGERKELRGRVVLDEIERELEGLEQPGFHGARCRVQIVGGDPDRADLARIAGPGDRLVGPARGEDLLERLRVGDVVQLVDVDPVGFELPQRKLEMSRRAGGVPRPRLGGDDHLPADRREGGADLLLARGVHVGGVEKGHPEVEAVPHQGRRLRARQRDDRNPPEADLGNLKTRLTQSNLLHAPS